MMRLLKINLLRKQSFGTTLLYHLHDIPVFSKHLILKRNIYNHCNTEIEGLEKFLKSLDHEKRLPNFLEANPYISQEDCASLYASFPGVVEDVISLPFLQHLPLGIKKTEKLMEHVLCLTPYFSAQFLMVHNFYAKQRIKQKLNSVQEEKDRLYFALKLAWGVEMVLRSLFVMDDLLDTADKRNDVTTWVALYKKAAARDATILGIVGCLIIRKYFQHMDCYGKIIDETYELQYGTQVTQNQFCELNFNPKLNPKLRKITLNQLLNMHQRLNAPGIVNSAVTTSMIYNGYEDSKIINTAKRIGYETMTIVTIFDDHNDCFGSDMVVERTSEDIRNGKQTWMLYKAIELASSEQFERLQEFYGRNDPASLKQVLNVYHELNIKELTLQMGEAKALKLKDEINCLNQDVFPCFIWRFLIDHYHNMTIGKCARI